MMDKLQQAVQKFKQSVDDRRYHSKIATNARVGLGHAGGQLAVSDWLQLQADFAHAKDAVNHPFDPVPLQQSCAQLSLPHYMVDSQAANNIEFLLRPDLGRLLHADSVNAIASLQDAQSDLLILISGGLSPSAIHKQIPDFLPEFHRLCLATGFSVAPVMINPRGRVALGDDINHIVHAKIAIVLIGERPGLGTSDSMGIYFTYNARRGCTDEVRNCISNVHQYGLSPVDAASKLHYMITKSLEKRLSGVGLKDDQSQYLTHL